MSNKIYIFIDSTSSTIFLVVTCNCYYLLLCICVPNQPIDSISKLTILCWIWLDYHQLHLYFRLTYMTYVLIPVLVTRMYLLIILNSVKYSVLLLWLKCTCQELTSELHLSVQDLNSSGVCQTYLHQGSLSSSLQDLNRQVVKSDSASFAIPELQFESPAFSQKGGKS